MHDFEICVKVSSPPHQHVMGDQELLDNWISVFHLYLGFHRHYFALHT